MKTKLIWGASVMALTTASGWWSRSIAAECDALLATSPEVADKDIPYTFLSSGEKVHVGDVWEDPHPQSRGAGWYYDLFTPPRLYRNEFGEGWFLTPPSLPEAETAGAGFPVEVEELCVPLFRLQLVGFGGEPGRYFGLFEKVESGETLVGRPGRTLDDLQLVIEDLQVAVESLPADLMDVRSWVARARIRDLTTNENIDLVSLARVPFGSRRVKIRVEGDSQSIWKREDESVDTPRGRYFFDEIVSDPARVVMVGERRDDPVERREFQPRVIHAVDPRSDSQGGSEPITEFTRAPEALSTSLPASSLFR